jgi:hypothetical protein
MTHLLLFLPAHLRQLHLLHLPLVLLHLEPHRLFLLLNLSQPISETIIWIEEIDRKRVSGACTCMAQRA